MSQELSLLKGLITSYPGLHSHLVRTCDEWLREDGSVSACAIFFATARLCMDRFLNFDFEGSDHLFGFVEKCLESDNQELADAAATCFLESVTNSVEMAPLAVSLMGPLSKQNCKEWDRFHGPNICGLNTD